MQSEITHKGITAYLSAGEIGFTTLFIDVTIRSGEKRFEFYDPELDDVDYRENVIDDNSLIDLKCDPDKYQEMLDWIESETIKDFYKDIIDKDYLNLNKYEIKCNNQIKLYFSGKCVAAGESDIEDYIDCIGF